MIKISLSSSKVLLVEETGKENVYITFCPKVIAVGNKISIEAFAAGIAFKRNLPYTEIEFAGGVKATVQEAITEIANLLAGFPTAMV